MFVVRIVIDDERTDYKVFEKREDAKRRFLGASSLVYDQAVESATLFHVPDVGNAPAAVQAVKSGAKNIIILDQVPAKIDLDLTGLDI